MTDNHYLSPALPGVNAWARENKDTYIRLAPGIASFSFTAFIFPPLTTRSLP
jgi:hypothetical protein